MNWFQTKTKSESDQLLLSMTNRLALTSLGICLATSIGCISTRMPTSFSSLVPGNDVLSAQTEPEIEDDGSSIQFDETAADDFETDN